MTKCVGWSFVLTSQNWCFLNLIQKYCFLPSWNIACFFPHTQYLTISKAPVHQYKYLQNHLQNLSATSTNWANSSTYTLEFLFTGPKKRQYIFDRPRTLLYRNLQYFGTIFLWKYWMMTIKAKSTFFELSGFLSYR